MTVQIEVAGEVPALSDRQFLALVELFCADILAELDASGAGAVESPSLTPLNNNDPLDAESPHEFCAA